MSKANSDLVDRPGDEVLRFISSARNLSRIGELADEVVAIAKSGHWRHYRTALGVSEWRECEFDYFLVACDLRHEDIGRVVLHTGEWSTLAKIMDPNAGTHSRRTLDDAAASWPASSHETLVERAQRLGWTRSPQSTRLRAAPLPPKRPLAGPGVGESQRRLLSRLAKRRPDLYRRVLDGDLSGYAAAREAGLVAAQFTISTDPERAAETLRKHLGKRALRRLAQLLVKP